MITRFMDIIMKNIESESYKKKKNTLKAVVNKNNEINYE
jgi:hypothetical protein